MAGDEETAATQDETSDAGEPRREDTDRPDADKQHGDDKDWSSELAVLWNAALALTNALRGFCTAILGLARSEWQLARASLPLLLGTAVLLVGLALSLWASVVALAGWGLYVATGSVAWALTALLGLQLALTLLALWWLRRICHNMSMPATRQELTALLARVRSKPGAGP